MHIGCQAALHQLHGDVAREHRVEARVQHAHAAFADLPLHAIALGDHRAGLEHDGVRARTVSRRPDRYGLGFHEWNLEIRRARGGGDHDAAPLVCGCSESDAGSSDA